MAGYIGSKANVSQIDGYVKSEVDTLLGQELNLSGGSMTGHLNFGDNIKIQSGAGTDLQIYHDASNSYIKDAGTGSLRLSATTIELMKVDTSELMASFAQDGAVTLYYDNAVKLATTSAGVSVTGNLTVTGTVLDLPTVNSYITGNGHNVLQVDGTRTYFYGGTNGVQFRTADNASELVSIDNGGMITTVGRFINATGSYDPWLKGVNSSGTETSYIQKAGNAYFAGNVGIGTSNGDVTSDGTAARTYVGIIGTGNRGRLNLGSTAVNGADSGTLSFVNGANELGALYMDTNSGVQNAGKMYMTATDDINISSVSDVIYKTTSTNSTAGHHIFKSYNTEIMKIDGGNNNVGIGPSHVIDELLHLEKSSGTTLVKTEVGGNSVVGFEIKKTGSTTSNWRIVDGQTVNGNLEFYDVTDSRLVMAMDGSGNVGIGESSPLGKLHVKTSDSGATVDGSADELVIESSSHTGMTILTGASHTGSIYFGDSGTNWDGYIAYSQADRKMTFGTAAGGRMSIDSTGKVLVTGTGVFGTSNASTHGVDKVLSAISAGNANQQLGLYDTLADSSTRYSAVFHRVGTNASMTWVGSISNTSNSVAFNTSSDYRLKENVSYTWDATTRLKGLKPCRFNFIADDTDTLVDGFLAHEVSSYCPQAVMEEKDGDIMQSIDHSKLVPLLVKTIQELEARITILEA